MAPPVVDQEFVVHAYAPLAGPQAADAYRQTRQVWAALRGQLGMVEAIRGFPALATLPGTPAEFPADGVVAVQESIAATRQSALRRVHDVLNLSVYFGQAAPEDPTRRRAGKAASTPLAQRRLGWAEQAQLWAQACGAGMGAVLGETRVMVARMPAGAPGEVQATSELGQSLDVLLPYREDRPPDWWRWGVTSSAGYAVWDTWGAADTGPVREIVLIAPADRDQEVSAWAWSDGTAALPPFAQYLMHATELRYEDRVLDAWRRRRGAAGEMAGLLAELNVALSPLAPHPAKVELLSARLSRLRGEEARLITLEADLARLGLAVSTAQKNLGEIPGCEAGSDGRGMFAADHALARWLTSQVENDLHDLRIELAQATQVRARATEELAQARRGDAVAAPDAGGTAEGRPQTTRSAKSGPAASDAGRPGISRRVFVVHGRDAALVSRFRDLLHIAGLDPLDWQELVEESGSTAPYLGQLVAQAPHLAQATLVLLSPDDNVQLHSSLLNDNDHAHERAYSCQARPNVYFELGLAIQAYPKRTVVVEVGRTRPVGDLAGLNVIRFDGSAISIRKVLDRLQQAGCPVDFSGTDWMEEHRFTGLAAYQRHPESRPC